MTKHIRVENADTSSWPVRVTVQDKNADGQWVDVSSQQLDYPTAMTHSSTYITSHRRLVIEERPADPKPTTP